VILSQRRTVEARSGYKSQVQTEPLPTPDAVIPAEPGPEAKPTLRGVVHQWAFFVALAAGVMLVILAPEGRAKAACAVYAAGLAGLLGTSALYHRITWRNPATRAWMRRLDHSMIFLLIAGTYTPFAALVLTDQLQDVVLVGVWAGAAAGIVFTLVWVSAPKWLTAATYVSLGWFSLIALPQIADRAGAGAVVLLAAGGVAYTAGAVIYARRSPNPYPGVFGYHEVFHVLVVVAALLHFVAIATYAVPAV
jgi:hemolysin III